MPENLITALLYGPQGPDNRRFKDDNWGATVRDAVSGNDDENFVEKTKILGKYALFGAGATTIADICMFNNTGGLPVALQRVKFHFVPWLGSVLAYQSAVSVSCKIRGKSDQTNHMIGGIAAGTVIGKCARSIYTGMFAGIVIGVHAWFYKDSVIKGYHVWPMGKDGTTGLCASTPPIMTGNAFTHKLDTSFMKKSQGNMHGYWARTPEEVDTIFKQGQLGDGNITDRQW